MKPVEADSNSLLNGLLDLAISVVGINHPVEASGTLRLVLL